MRPSSSSASLSSSTAGPRALAKQSRDRPCPAVGSPEPREDSPRHQPLPPRPALRRLLEPARGGRRHRRGPSRPALRRLPEPSAAPRNSVAPAVSDSRQDFQSDRRSPETPSQDQSQSPS